MKIPKIGDEIWLPGGKRKVLAIRQSITEMREHDIGSDKEISRSKNIIHHILVAGDGEFRMFSGPSRFRWEDNLDGQQEYFEEHFKRRNCRKCQFPLPWDKCEIHR